MIIGIDASQANLRQRTGTEWYAYNILREWIKSETFIGHTVRLYVRESLVSDFPALPSNWHVRVLTWKPQILWTQIRLSLEIAIHPVDILFIPAHVIPLIHPKNTFTTIHDIGFETSSRVYSQKHVTRVRSSILQKIISVTVRIITLGKYGGSELDYHRFSVRFALRHAKAIFTVSKFSKNEILKAFPHHPNIIVASNGLFFNEYPFPYPKKDVASIKEKYKLGHYILTVGRIEKKKNSLLLIRAFNELRKFSAYSGHLVLVGNRGFGYEEVEKYVFDNHLDNVVNFFGWIPQHDIIPLIAGAQLFAFFSEYEGFGVPVLQSLALGTPVLTSKLDVFNEIGGDAINTCDVHNAQASAEALNKLLLLSPEQKEKMVRYGRQKSLRYSWEKTAHQIASYILHATLA